MYRKVLAVVLFTLVLVTNGWTQERKRLKEYTTDHTSLTNEDIMRLFVNEVRTYLQRYDNCYYEVEFKVYQEEYMQDVKWQTWTEEYMVTWVRAFPIGDETDEYVFKVIVFGLFISNAYFEVHISDHSFSKSAWKSTRQDTVGGSEIRQYIVDMATSMFNESEMRLKMNNDKYSDKTKTAFLTEIMRILF